MATSTIVKTNLKWIAPDTTPSRPKWDPRPATVKDIRGHEQDFTLDKNGFEHHTSPTKFIDFGNDAAVRSGYSREVEDIIKRLTGATYAHAVGHVERVSDKSKKNAQSPASMIHAGRPRLPKEVGHLEADKMGRLEPLASPWQGDS